MAKVNHFKVSAMPGTPVGDSIYSVLVGNFVEMYVTESDGTPHKVYSAADVAAAVTTALGAKNLIEIVDTITQRDALFTGSSNVLCLVNDATPDPTVDLGAALYSYRGADSVVTKVAEYESMDNATTLAWANITGGPTSTPAQLDQSVTDSHTHGNKSVLDNLSDAGGILQYGGVNIGSEWAVIDW